MDRYKPFSSVTSGSILIIAYANKTNHANLGQREATDFRISGANAREKVG